MSEDLELTNSETGQEELDNSETVEEQETSDSSNAENEEAQPQEKKGDSQLYARVKRAEAELKKERAKSASQEKIEQKFSEQDPYELAKTVQALKDFSPEEIDVIKRQATVLEITPAEAASNEDVQAIISHRREKLQAEQTNPTPTNRQEPQGEDFSSWTPETVEKKFNEGDAGRKQIDEYYRWLKSK